jgi:ribosomal protein S12 methylthiotransferase
MSADSAPGKRTIHFVSLGCPKNRVDSEVMLGVAERAGYSHVSEPGQANVIVVNTCGFIDAAKRESIETILALSEHKQGSCEKLVVSGCLSQRYPNELASDMPEVDHFLGSSDMLKLEHVLKGGADRILVGNPADWVVSATDPRRISTRGRSAYVKIAEGCNRTCAFCVIPELRGKQRSRTPDDIVREVEDLAARGVVEVNLVSQDTVAYGRDLKEAATSLAALVRRIADVPGLRWVRLFYLYPEKLDDELVELIATHPKIVKYIDMPLQHAADGMLRRMRRGHGGQRLYDLVERLRTRIPELVFRTAFIVGHPGETEAEFEELLALIRFAQFDRVGVFQYSDEPSARAFNLDDKVPAQVAAARAKKLMSIQRKISKQKNQALVGKQLEVLVEGPSEESELVMVGRHAGQAPDIDGVVYLSAGPTGAEARPGEMRLVHIESATDYDLLGELATELPIALPKSKRRTQVEADPNLAHRSSDGRRVTLRTV